MRHRPALVIIGGMALFTLSFVARDMFDPPAAPNPYVVGIGGIFFKCKDPKAMRA